MNQKEIESCGSRLLQPLREIGLSEKTQCWDIDDIQAALREAFCRGIAVESLYGQQAALASPSHPVALSPR